MDWLLYLGMGLIGLSIIGQAILAGFNHGWHSGWTRAAKKFDSQLSQIRCSQCGAGWKLDDWKARPGCSCVRAPGLGPVELLDPCEYACDAVPCPPERN